ncbi:MAG: 5,6-dimethylbenzimidazole synthase [Gemmobacter sp.]
MTGGAPAAPPTFGPGFRAELDLLMRWRRDVRHFRTDPVPQDALARALAAFALAPSVGLSEPWRLVRVQSPRARAAVTANFETANAAALARYDGARADLYAGLKLAGLREAPEHLAVFCDEATAKGAGLGAATMPETRAYSVVSAITLFWLALRTEGLGLGWVSILDPARLAADLGLPQDWRLVGYLCIGWPADSDDQPELDRLGWETRAQTPPMEWR